MNVYEVKIVEVIKRSYSIPVQAVDEDSAIEKAYETCDNDSHIDGELVDQYVSSVEYIQRVGQSDELSHYN